MTVFRTPARLASWAGICPATTPPGGRSRSGRTRHGSVALRTALSARPPHGRKNTYLAAITPISVAAAAYPKPSAPPVIAYWHVVHDQVDYADLGRDWAHRRRSPHPSPGPPTRSSRPHGHPGARRLIERAFSRASPPWWSPDSHLSINATRSSNVALPTPDFYHLVRTFGPDTSAARRSSGSGSWAVRRCWPAPDLDGAVAPRMRTNRRIDQLVRFLHEPADRERGERDARGPRWTRVL